MASPTRQPAAAVIAYRFEAFEADLRLRELRKFGIRLRLEPKPWQLLVRLLESAGRVVTRAELERQLWDEGVFVDFQHGLNVAVQKLREVLGDSADQPRFIETVAGKGYRFVATVERIPAAPIEEAPAPLAAPLPLPIPALTVPHHTRRWILSSVIAVTIVSAATFFVWKKLQDPPPLLREPGWIVIGDFENRTGESLLDGTLEYALERDLSNSQFVRIAPRQRVEDVLQLMKAPINSRIDRRLGQEVCIRDGDLHALIIGRAEKIGSTYVLSVEVVNPANGATTYGLSESAGSTAQLEPAVRRLSGRVRRALGEDPQLIEASLENLQKVTTPSLRALQLYSQADRLVSRGYSGNHAAAELLEEALKEDPNFASAHLLLGFAYYHIWEWKEAVKSTPHFARAFALADTVPERERLFIRGAYYSHVANQQEKASEEYETLLRLYPDHYWGYGNLLLIYNNLGRCQDSARIVGRMAELRPSDFAQAILPARYLTDCVWQNPNLGPGLLDQAVAWGNRAVRVLDSQHDNAPIRVVARFHHVLAWQRFLAGNISQANAEFELGLRDHRPGDGFDRSFVSFAMLLGKLHQAGEIAAAAPREAGGQMLEFTVAAYQNDIIRARHFLNLNAPLEDLTVAEHEISEMIRMGMLREARQLSRRMMRDPRCLGATQLEAQVDAALQVEACVGVSGEVALATGQTNRGKTELERYITNGFERFGTNPTHHWESLADTYHKERRFADELRALAECAARRGDLDSFSAPLHLRLRLKLADLYRELGRTSDAEKVEADLRKELAFADPDHPILVALQHRQQSATSAQK